jgi:hypothetical protein
MIDRTQQQTTLDRIRTKDNPRALQVGMKKSSGVNQWMYNLTKWLGIIERWERESRLIMKLVTLTTFGQEEAPDLLSSSKALKLVLEEGIGGLKQELFDLECRKQELLLNKLVFKRRIDHAKLRMQKVALKYDQAKSKVLEDLAHSYPLTII